MGTLDRASAGTEEGIKALAKNDNWMPLYIGDFLADTMHLDSAQTGAYLLLLMHSWRNGPLPDDDAQLASIARTTPRDWKRMRVVIRAFFSDFDGRLTQKRLEQERERSLDTTIHRKAAGKAGSDARWIGKTDSKRIANALQIDSKRIANGMADASVCHRFANTPLPVDISLSKGERDISTYTRACARDPDRAETRSGLGGQRAPLEPDESPRLDPEAAKAAFAGLVSSLTGRPIYEIQEPTMTVNEQLAALLRGDEP